jgi:hypothetical protein
MLVNSNSNNTLSEELRRNAVAALAMLIVVGCGSFVVGALLAWIW